MSLSTLFIGIMLIITSIIFLRNPKAVFLTNPEKDIKKMKAYLEGFPPHKKVLLRIAWSIILILGIIITYLSLIGLF